jgi:hypothetical protein
MIVSQPSALLAKSTGGTLDEGAAPALCSKRDGDYPKRQCRRCLTEDLRRQEQVTMIEGTVTLSF